MITNLNIVKVVLLLTVLITPVFAALDGDITPELPVTIPVFNGVMLDDVELGAIEGEVGACTYNLDMIQSISSSKITGSGKISATDFDVKQNGVLVVNFEGDIDFSSLATIAGSVVRLTGAKSKILNAVGDGFYTDDEGSREVTVTKVVATFVFNSLHVDLGNATIGGGGDSIAKGPISVSGYDNTDPTSKETIKGSYDAIDFPESEFPAENIVTPALNIVTSTSGKGAVNGGGEGAIGPLDDIPFGVKGKRNAKNGVSTLTLKGTGAAKSFSATLNLYDDGDLATGGKFKNTLNALGYKLKF